MGVAKLAEDGRLMVFEDAYSMWTERRLTQEQLPRSGGVRRGGRGPNVAGIATALAERAEAGAN